MMLLTEAPERQEEALGLYVTPKTAEERAQTNGVKYAKIPVWTPKNSVYKVKGYLLTDAPGKPATFRDPEEVMAEWQANADALKAENPAAKVPPKPQGVLLNGQRVFPAGEEVEILLPVQGGEERLKAIKAGSVVSLEGVSVYAKAIPRDGHPHPKGTLTHAPSSVMDKKDKDGKPVGVLVAYNDEKRKGPIQGYFHVNVAPGKGANQLPFTGPIMFAARPFVSTNSDKPAAPNDTPFMRRHIDSTSVVILEKDSSMHGNPTSLEELRELAEGWDAYRKENMVMPAPKGMVVEDPSLLVPGHSAMAVSFYRTRYDEAGNLIEDPNVAKEHLKAFEEKGGQPFFSFVVQGYSIRGDDGQIRNVSLAEALDKFVENHNQNVARYQGRLQENKNEGGMMPSLFEDMMSGGKWTVRVIPGTAVNLGPTMRSKVKNNGFDPRSDFEVLTRAPSDMRVNDRGLCYPYNSALAVREVFEGIATTTRDGSPLKMFRAEGVSDGVADLTAVSVQGTNDEGETVEVLAGYIVTDTRPTVPNSAIPLHAVIPESVPAYATEAVAEKLVEIETLKRAAQFAPRTNKAAAIPKNEEDAPAPAPGM
jgi:hypothetical protein